MSTTEYSRLGKLEDTWTCPNCDKPNNSSKIYMDPHDNSLSNAKNVSPIPSHNSRHSSIPSDVSLPSTHMSTDSSQSTDSNTESYNSTASSGSPEPDPGLGEPVMSSSPKAPQAKPLPPKRSLRILNVNFQSVKKKGNSLEAIIDSTDPDIILGTETWLDSSVSSSEFLPNYLGYDVRQRDRKSDSHGGVRGSPYSREA